MNLKELVGQQLMVGIAGRRVTDDTLALFRETCAGGVIFFRPNFESAVQFRALIAELEEKLQRRLLVAIDHEGGRVIHLPEGATFFPDNLALGQTANPDYARRQGEIEAKELRRLGMDLNLAPTLDVLTAKYSPNIGIRSYSSDPELASKLGSERIRGMRENGLAACAKHFPGQGQSPLDAHLDLPVLPTTWEEFRSIHLKPFLAAIDAGVEAIMSSHPIYPNLDPTNVPATFSKRIVGDFLRGEIKFNGLILSDDLEMGALKGLCPIGESAVRAIEAGHDMVLVCHDASAAREVSNALVVAYETKRLNVKNLEASIERINAVKKSKRFSEDKSYAEPSGVELAAQVAREAICPSPYPSPQKGEGKFFSPSPLWGEGGVRGTTVIYPRLSELNKLIAMEKEMLDDETFIRSVFEERVEVRLIGLKPTEQEVNDTLAAVKNAERIIFFCYDAHLDVQTRRLLDEIQSGACSVILLRDPFDEEWVRPESACVKAYGFRSVQIRAAVEALVGKTN